MIMYRQGDVLVMQVKEIPTDATLVARDSNNRIVLAYGEVTGHAHAIHDKHALLKQTSAGQVFLNILRDTAYLVHEEHSTVQLPPGNYEVRRQREYSPEAIRNVED